MHATPAPEARRAAWRMRRLRASVATAWRHGWQSTPTYARLYRHWQRAIDVWLAATGQIEPGGMQRQTIRGPAALAPCGPMHAPSVEARLALLHDRLAAAIQRGQAQTRAGRRLQRRYLRALDAWLAATREDRASA